MSTRKYKTELDQSTFFTKLSDLNIFNLLMPIKGELDVGKGIINCGFICKKKFVVEFINEKEIIVKSRSSYVEIFLWIITSLTFIVATYLLIKGDSLIGFAIISLLNILVLIILFSFNILSWRKIDRLLRRYFICTKFEKK